MNELVYLKKEEALTDSLLVAEAFEKRHTDVIRAIENKIKNDSTQNCVQCFIKTRYKDSSGKWNTKYLINRDGFSFLIMGFTGKKADAWKWKYIDAFNKMESVITEKKTAAWLDTRKHGMIVRRNETDVIKNLVEYARQQGSTHADMLYMTYSRLANKFAGIQTRDTATTEQLNRLSIYEGIALHIMQDGMVSGKNYKDIYQDTKARFSTIQELAYLT